MEYYYSEIMSPTVKDSIQWYQVRVGEWYLKRVDGTERDYDVAEIHVHKKWNKVKGKMLSNDIALIRLKQAVDFSGPYAGRFCLNRSSGFVALTNTALGLEN